MPSAAAFPVVLICTARSLRFLSSNLQNMLFGIPMLCGKTVARKQN